MPQCLPAGMMPIWRGHGCKATAGSFTQRPASCCVRSIKPWSNSLNMPSPPTQTTLSKTNTKVYVSPETEPVPSLSLKVNRNNSHVSESSVTQGLTRLSRSGPSSGDGLWPGSPAQSLNKRWFYLLCGQSQSIMKTLLLDVDHLNVVFTAHSQTMSSEVCFSV